MGVAAVLARARRVTLYIADSLNGRIRVLDPDGTISTLGGKLRFATPTRLAYHPAGWLYVKDASSSGVTAVSLSRPALATSPTAPRRAAGRESHLRSSG